MRTKSVVKWGAVAIMVLTGLIAWMVVTDERLSRRENDWRNKANKEFQEDFKPGTVKR